MSLTRHVAFRLSIFLLLWSVVLVASPPTAAAETATAAPTLAGHWEGAIDISGGKLGIDVDFTKREDGTWSGDISIPQQGAKDLPLTAIDLTGTSFTFQIVGVPGLPTFKGKITDDGALAGDFTQGTAAGTFRLEGKAPPDKAAKKALAGFDALVDEAITKWDVPGLAMAIVVDGKVVLSKGFGYRNLKDKTPVTSGTLFAIGSATKAFTTFTLGTLVDEGKIEWDTPARQYIPWLKFKDPMATERMTTRDLVTHRSGLPRHDLLWYNSDFTRKEMVQHLAYLEPMTDLRAEWHYQNLMYLTAGFLVEEVTGRSWEDNVRQRIFEPLSMTHSNFSVIDSARTTDYALPYDEGDNHEGVKEIPFRNITSVGPAGSINSSIEDMTQWILVHLNGGKLGDRQIIGQATLADIHAPHMAIAAPSERPEIPQTSYAMGWFVQPYRGHNRLQHGGNIDGFSALVSFLPDDDIGMVVLTNRNGTGLPEILMRHAMDTILGLPPIQWNSEALAKREKGKEALKDAEKKKETLRVRGTKPSHALADYAGEYENPGYGIIKVSLAGDHLELTYNNIATPLAHWHYDVFNGLKAKDPVFEDAKFMFLTNMKGDIDAIQTPFEPQVKDVVFGRKPDQRMFDPGYLSQFVGDYEFPDQKFTIELKGNVLTMSVPGQPQYQLVPDRLNSFTLKQVSTISITFLVDEKEGVKEATFNQPNGVFTAKKKKN